MRAAVLRYAAYRYRSSDRIVGEGVDVLANPRESRGQRGYLWGSIGVTASQKVILEKSTPGWSVDGQLPDSTSDATTSLQPSGVMECFASETVGQRFHPVFASYRKRDLTSRIDRELWKSEARAGAVDRGSRVQGETITGVPEP
jgi:hypothetical protein